MHVEVDFDASARYRVFAHVGNLFSDDGVTVTVHTLSDGNSVQFQFCSRNDAAVFFRHLASAAEETTATEEDEGEPGRALMAEDVTTAWEEIAARGDEPHG